MAKFVVIKPIQAGSGFINDKDGKLVPMQSLVPKPDSIIEGKIQVKSILNNNVKGVPYNIPTKVNGKLMLSTIMIPEENLEMIEADRQAAPPVIQEVMSENKVEILLPDTNKESDKKIEIEEESEAPIFDLLGHIFN